jgi:hypothetical protein
MTASGGNTGPAGGNAGSTDSAGGNTGLADGGAGSLSTSAGNSGRAGEGGGGSEIRTTGAGGNGGAGAGGAITTGNTGMAGSQAPGTGGTSGSGSSADARDGGVFLDAGTGLSPDTIPCTGPATCPVLPATCKRIVQAPNACCATCEDSGCATCAPLTCPAGTHQETAVGACCPTCVSDPCAKAQQEFEKQYARISEKFGSISCKNASDCSLQLVNNACMVACNVPVGSSMATSFQDNLKSATAGCTVCPAPTTPVCASKVAACVNEKCVAADPS